jgi:hypothetical protein
MKYAGTAASVKEVSFYHGGDQMYVLQDLPGQPSWKKVGGGSRHLQMRNSSYWRPLADQPFLALLAGIVKEKVESSGGGVFVHLLVPLCLFLRRRDQGVFGAVTSHAAPPSPSTW